MKRGNGNFRITNIRTPHIFRIPCSCHPECTKDPKYGNEALPYDGCIVYHLLQNDRKIYRSIFIELSPHSLQCP